MPRCSIKTLKATITVFPNGEFIITLPPLELSLSVGDYQAIVIINEQFSPHPPRQGLQFNPYAVTLIAPNFTFRRQDLYDDGD